MANFYSNFYLFYIQKIKIPAHKIKFKLNSFKKSHDTFNIIIYNYLFTEKYIVKNKKMQPVQKI